MGPSLRDRLAYAAILVFRPAAQTRDFNASPQSIPFAADRREGEAMQRRSTGGRRFGIRVPNPLPGDRLGKGSMLGIADTGVTAAAALTLLGVMLCLGYGLWRWNDEGEDGPPGRKSRS